ncbi:MAG TPA: trigger factor [Acidimicrobiales bacterium]|nr:trigger factor [Acidimicrobiales bacterium]
MRATTESLEDSKVRLSVEVDESEVDRALDQTVRKMAREARVPGFRPGKVPRRVLEARMGGSLALRGEALREALPDFYAQAVTDTQLDAIAPPEIDITGGQESGPVSFDAVVQVRPTVHIPGYAGLRAVLPGLTVTDEEITAQIDRLRENDGELLVVERPAADKDNATINIHAKNRAGAEVMGADDYLYEVGSGRVVPELDESLRGAKAGDILDFSATVPGADSVSFRVLVKEVKEKRLPELTDGWVSDNSEFQTVADLEADIRQRMARVKVVQAQFALRERGITELVDLVGDEVVPQVLIDEELRQRLHDLGHRLDEQKISFEQFLSATGRNGDELLAELRLDALRAVKADLALRALADAEGIDVTDEELETGLQAMAGRLGVDPKVLRTQVDRSGRTGAVRSEQRKAKALDWLLDNIELVDEAGNPISRDDLRVDQGERDQGGEREDTVEAEETVVAATADEADG